MRASQLFDLQGNLSSFCTKRSRKLDKKVINIVGLDLHNIIVMYDVLNFYYMHIIMLRILSTRFHITVFTNIVAKLDQNLSRDDLA